MKVKFTFVLFIFISFLLMGCEKNNNLPVDVVTFQPFEYDVSLVTNPANNHSKNLYIDALIELKAKHPDAFNNVRTAEKYIEEIDNLSHVNETTLIISKDGQTISRLSGEQDKAKIIYTLEQIMEE